MRDDVARVVVNPDTPQPRCLVVRPDQRLEVRNDTTLFGQRGTRVVVTFASVQRAIEPGEVVTFRRPLGEIAGNGFHDLELDLNGLRWVAEIHVVDRAIDAAAGSAVVSSERVSVLSHCGVRSLRVDGRLWLADPPLGGHNPPPGWNENETRGYFRQTGPQRGEFRGDRGQRATFGLASAGAADPNAGCE